MKELPQHHHRDLAQLLMQLVDGGLNEAQIVDLRTVLRNDPAARRFYLSYMRMHALLQQELEGRHVTFVLPPAEPPPVTLHDNGEFANGVMEDSGTFDLMREVLEQEARAREIREARQEALLEQERIERAERQRRMRNLISSDVPVKPVRHVVIPTWVVYGAVAAMIAVVFMLSYPWLPRTENTATSPGNSTAVVEPKVDSVGVITSVIDAQWEDGTPVVASASVMPGRVRTLASGLTRISLGKGASIYVEAPATFEPVADDHIRLLKGRIVGYCPPGAEGFTVTTPHAHIVDLGTEFGVWVQDDSSITHVFSGGVRVVPTQAGGKSDVAVELRANEALHIDSANQITRLRADRLAFVRPVEFDAHLRAQAGSAYHRWLVHSLTLRRDPSLLLYYAFEHDDELSGILRNVAWQGNSSHGVIFGSNWTSGRFRQKRAMRFTPDDAGVEFHVPGQFNHMTMAAWVRLDTLIFLPQTIFHSDGIRRGYANWLFSENGGMGFGIIDETQVRADKLLGANDLGQWRHVAVVIDESVVTMYLNGRLVRTQTIVPVAFSIGSARLGNWNPLDTPTLAPNRPLRGDIDEFLLFDRALNAQEIAAIYEAGRPEDE